MKAYIRLTNTLLHSAPRWSSPASPSGTGENPGPPSTGDPRAADADRVPSVERKRLGFFPIRVGDGDVEGMVSTRLFPMSAKERRTIGRPIVSRLRLSSWCRPSSVSRRCRPELNDRTTPVNRERLIGFLKRPWMRSCCRPATLAVELRIRTELKEQLRQCVAFVQLLGRKTLAT